MTEEQKQAVADAKIRLSEIPNSGRSFEEHLALEALELVTPQAHASVQNGTCDEGVACAFWRLPYAVWAGLPLLWWCC